MSHPVCERCGREIQPGQMVSFVGKSDEELAEQRIILGDDLVLVHAEAADCQAAELEEA